MTDPVGDHGATAGGAHGDLDGVELGSRDSSVLTPGVRETRRGALRRDWHLLPRTLPYLRPYRRQAAMSVLITIVLAAVALAEPWPLAFIVDSVIGNKPAPDWVEAIFGGGLGSLILFAIVATLLITLVSGVFTVLNEYLTTTVDQRMVLDLRSDMFEHAQRLSLSFHDDERMGVLMYRINNQAAALGRIVVGLPVIAQSVLTIVGMGFVAYKIDPLLAALALGVTPFIFYSTSIYTDRIEPRLYRVRGMEAMNLTIVHEAMSMLRVILAFGHEKREFARFRSQGEATVDARVDLTVRQTAFQLAVQFITAAGTAAVIGVGAYRAVNGHISAGELLVILTYIHQIYRPLEELTNTIAQYQQDFISLRFAFDLLETSPEVEEKPDARAIDRARGEIEFEGVSFAYRTRAGVLNDVSFRVPAGRAVALVGPTGAGKSTLVSLLPRFYDPQHGRVFLDGHDIRDLTLESVRAQYSIVLQEPLLFSGTIADNIGYGKPGSSLEEVQEAARAANVHDFIAELPEGYDTVLGERGAKISGGERQRIAVARAFLRDAPILILDEPTSSIDSRTEGVILDALDRLMEGRTTIVIAHRLSTVRAVDEVLVMRDGRLVEAGDHDELLSRRGLYHELWIAQAGERRNASGETESALGALSAPGTPGTPLAGLPPVTTREPTPTPNGVVAPGLRRPKIVLLGMLTKIPVGGPAWLAIHYAIGFDRLGYDVYYVEAHSRTPSMFMKGDNEDGTTKAVRYLASVMERFGLGDRWAFQALHEGGRCFGMSAERLEALYRNAALILNMHGGTLPLPEHAASQRLVFMGTDPGEVEIEIERGDARALEFLEQHHAFFTWGLSHGNPDSLLPWSSRFPFVPSPPPVILDLWESDREPDGAPFTTIGNWRQSRPVERGGRTYSWSKHEEFVKILRLPSRVRYPLELALSTYDGYDRLLLAEHGWRVRPALEMSADMDSYRDYILGSAGELSAAKEQNVSFRSGWFSERSATYLAGGRPVVLQETGFSNALPTGEGLFAFNDIDEAASAIEAVCADPPRHRRAAREIAREYLAHDVVLGDLLAHVGLPARQRRRPASQSPASPQPPLDLSLEPRSRRPLELPEETVERATRRPVPAVAPPAARLEASVVIPVLDNLVCTRLTLESLLANTERPGYEVVVIDNGSAEPTRRYLQVLASRNRNVRVIRNDANHGFAAAANQGLAAAMTDQLVLLNNDTIVVPDWLARLTAHLADPEVALVGPITNRCGGPAQIPTTYRTYGELLSFARERTAAVHGDPLGEVPITELFCTALRRDVLEAVGPLDEQFELGMFEDDDYARRVRDLGYRVVCAEDVFVHHFGEASLGRLASEGRYGELFHANRSRFERKWGVEWKPHGRRFDREYETLKRRVRAAVSAHVPEGATVLVVSHGDDEFVGLEGRTAWHFPQLQDGRWAGRHPDNDDEAVAELERLRAQGATYLVLPTTSGWWLDHYEGFRRHLERYRCASEDAETAVIYELEERVTEPIPLRASA